MREYTKQEIALKNLSNALIMEQARLNLTNIEMSLRCDLSFRNYCRIIYGENKSVKIETLISICENTDITYSDIFAF